MPPFGTVPPAVLTVAVKVTDWPKTAAEAVRVVAVVPVPASSARTTVVLPLADCERAGNVTVGQGEGAATQLLPIDAVELPDDTRWHSQS